METDSYFTYSMPAQLWRRGRIALAQNNQAKFCVFRCNQEDSSKSSFFYAAFFTMRSISNLDFSLAKGNSHMYNVCMYVYNSDMEISTAS